MFKAGDTENGFFSSSLIEVTKANLYREMVEGDQRDISCDLSLHKRFFLLSSYSVKLVKKSLVENYENSLVISSAPEDYAYSQKHGPQSRNLERHERPSGDTLLCRKWIESDYCCLEELHDQMLASFMS